MNLGLGFKEAYERINFGDESMPQSLSAYLEAEGYDLVVLDYDDGGDYLPRTSLFIKEAIRFINTKKHQAGSDQKNVIIGQSMGGMCSRYALRTMELNDEDHEVATYISFDSGHEGVNIPLGVQYILYDVGELVIAGVSMRSFIAKIDNVMKLIELPASRTMIKYQPLGVENLGGDYYYQQNEVLGLPQKCEILSIANGSQKGYLGTQNFSSSDLLLHVRENSIGIATALGHYDKFGDSPFLAGVVGFIGWTVGIRVRTNLKAWAMPHENFIEEPIHKAKISGMVFGIPITYIWRHTDMIDGMGIDASPGGLIFPHDINEFPLPERLVPRVYKLGGFCFTPTASTLNYYGPSNDGFNHAFTDFSNSLTRIQENDVKEIDNYAANTIIEPSVTFEEFKNTKHTWFTSESSDFLRFQLVGSDLLESKTSLIDDEVYHFGVGKLHYITTYTASTPRRTSSNLTTSLLVTDLAKLLINGSSSIRVGLTPSGIYDGPDDLPPFTDDDSHFTMEIKNGCDETEPIELIIEDGAQLILGDNGSRTGDIVVHDNHSIIVRLGGKIIINNGSDLILNSGSNLVIQDGGEVIINDGGGVMTYSGSHIFYNLGAEIALNGENSRLELGGKLILATSAVFEPTHEAVSSGRVIIRNSEGTLIAGAYSEFNIVGDNINDPMLIIAEGGSLVAPEEMAELRFQNCQVLFRSSEDIPLQSFAPFRSSNVKYDVQSNLVDLGYHPRIFLHNNSLITSSDLHDVGLSAEQFGDISDGVFLRISNGEFVSTYNNVATQLDLKGGNLSLSFCAFSGYGQTALKINYSTSFSAIYYSTFTSASPSVGLAISDHSPNELLVKNCYFIGGQKGIIKRGGQLTLRCNNFSNQDNCSVYGDWYSRIEMSSHLKAGYNVFSDIQINNIKLARAQFLSINAGYNSFDENGNSYKTVEGTFVTPLPLGIVVPGYKNQWNPSNTVPTSEFEITHDDSGTPIYYSLLNPQSANCGVYDPGAPVLGIPGTGNYFPSISLTGESSSLKLDLAIANAFEESSSWDSTSNNLMSIQKYHDIFMHQYTQAELGDTMIQFYLNMAYQQMKNVISRGFAAGVITKSQNQTSFSTPVQKYVDVLNLRSQEDTINLYEYVDKFYLELDKAALFRMLGHTETGLDILQNVDLCFLDSSEQVVMNEWKFEFEEEIAKNQLGTVAYGIDTILTDVSGYYEPTSSQVTEYYFGSVINSISNITYRSCTGTRTPVDNFVKNIFPFRLYPNPSNGEINIEYEVPSESAVELVVYTIEGKEIERIVLQGGHRYKTLDITNVQSGIYIYELKVDGLSTEKGRISIVK